MLFSRQNILLSCKTEIRAEMHAGKERKDKINWNKVGGDFTQLRSSLCSEGVGLCFRPHLHSHNQERYRCSVTDRVGAHGYLTKSKMSELHGLPEPAAILNSL